MVKYIVILAIISSSLAACMGTNKTVKDTASLHNQYPISMSKDTLVIEDPSFLAPEHETVPVEIANGINLLYAGNGYFAVLDKRKDTRLLFYYSDPAEHAAGKIKLDPCKTIPEKEYGLILLMEKGEDNFNNRYKKWFDEFIRKFLAEFDGKEWRYWDEDLKILAFLNGIKYSIYPDNTGRRRIDEAEYAEYIEDINEEAAKIKGSKEKFEQEWGVPPHNEEYPEWLTRLADKTKEEKMEAVYRMSENPLDWDTRLGEDGRELRRAYYFFYTDIKVKILDTLDNEKRSRSDNYKRIEETLNHVLHELSEKIIKVIKDNYFESRKQLLTTIEAQINSDNLRQRIEGYLIGIADKIVETQDAFMTDYTVRPIIVDNHTIGTALIYPQNPSEHDKYLWERMVETVFTRKRPENADLVP